MNLMDVCEPVFSEVCLLNRAAGRPEAPGFDAVRASLKARIEQARKKAAESAGLQSEYSRVDEALIVFVDNILAKSRFPFASRWHEQRLAHELLTPPIYIGEARFFEHLDQALRDTGPTAPNVLMFYYTCLGLGFGERGPLRPEELQEKVKALASRLRDRIDFDLDGQLFPQAYKDVDDRDLTRSLRTPLKWTMLTALAALVAILVGGTAFVWTKTSSLRGVLSRLEERSQAMENHLSNQLAESAGGSK